MNDAFMKLHDFAVQSGLLERAPDFAEQLRGTTQIFLSLAQKSNEDAAGEEDQSSNADHTPRDTTAASRIEKQLSERVIEIPAPAVQPSKTETPTYGGFMITHEPLSPASQVPPTHDVHSGMGLGFDTAQPNLAGDYEVVTYPTLDNASFALGADFDFTDIGNAVHTPLSSLSPPSVYNPLPAPLSYASTEMTFGRRLQRTAAERAWTLISMPNPPPKRFARVFGFCLLFESHDSIKKRLSAVVERNRQESLSNWEYPFLQLGGAGTHYDLTSYSGSPIGNQGTVNVRKPKSNTGFGTGPFNEKIIEAGALLDKNMRINLPGFSAEFFDCDEVEGYLRERGITIPGGADYVTAEVDMSEFEVSDDTTDSPFPPFEHFGSPDFQEPVRYKPQYEEIQELDAINELNAPIRGPTFTSRSSSSSASDGASTTITIPSPEHDSASKGWSLGMATAEPLLGAFGHGDTSFMNTMGAAGDYSPNNGILSFTGLTHNVKRQVVTVDVNMLMFGTYRRRFFLGLRLLTLLCRND